ncbi:MAG: hypothetical protein F6J97_13505 [Leptolyngbya sp. SIO4C1]|nr:hypothetical protein [Leptolyngbya sp. SIO4C1]
MQWFMLIAIALTFATLGKRLTLIDEVYALATYSAGAVSGLWGFAIAPEIAQFLLEGLALSWLLRFARI